MAGVVPWSYSSLTAYETCPRRFYLTRIVKQVTEPQTEATLWGNEVHKALELAIKNATPLEPRFVAYAPIIDKLRAAPGQKQPEQKFGLTASFKPTSFFAKDVWFRGVLDLTILQPEKAVVLDYKTGKVKEDGDQLKLFAGATFAQNPYLQEVKTGYVWLAHNKVSARTFVKDEVPLIWQEFIPRIRRMEASQQNDSWPPRPSGLCKNWCPVGKRLCEHCGS
jgi:hypothetical protein